MLHEKLGAGEVTMGGAAGSGVSVEREGAHESEDRDSERDHGACCSRACGEEKLGFGRETMFLTIGSRDGRLVSTEVGAGPMGGIGPISHFGLEWSCLCPRLFSLFFFSFVGRNVLNSKISKMISNENVVNSKVVELINIHNFGFGPFSI